MQLKPIVESVMYALLAQQLGVLHPQYAAIIDPRRGVMFVPVQ
jgi:hypothetical protein